MVRAGSIPRARATSMNSGTSRRRSPRSTLDTKDCYNAFRPQPLGGSLATYVDCKPVLLHERAAWGGSIMPTNNPERLRAALDQIANALQPAVLLAGEPQRVSAATAQDAATLDTALARVVAILKTVQADQSE